MPVIVWHVFQQSHSFIKKLCSDNCNVSVLGLRGKGSVIGFEALTSGWRFEIKDWALE